MARLVATLPVRNEAWCISASVRSALRFCDAVIVLDHASTDETPDILGWLAVQYPKRIVRLSESNQTWREALYRQRMLEVARDRGATHLVTIDADEILTENAVQKIRGLIECLEPHEVLKVPWLMLWGSLDQYRAGDQSVWSSSTVPIAFKLTSDTFYTQGDYDIHCRVPTGLSDRCGWPLRDKGVMHLQHVSQRRLRAKQVLYKLVEVLRWGKDAEEIERRYSRTTDETGMKLQAVPEDWWGPERGQIDADAEPWQEGEVLRLLARYGRERFAGLDLMGF